MFCVAIGLSVSSRSGADPSSDPGRLRSSPDASAPPPDLRRSRPCLELGMMLDRLLALGEAAFVRIPRLLLAGREIAFLFLDARDDARSPPARWQRSPGARARARLVLAGRRRVPDPRQPWWISFQPGSRQFGRLPALRGSRPAPMTAPTGAPTEDEFQSAPSASDERHSAQSKVRVTAFFQSAYSWSTLALSICGVHSLSLPQFSRRSSTCAQNPTARPAA